MEQIHGVFEEDRITITEIVELVGSHKESSFVQNSKDWRVAGDRGEGQNCKFFGKKPPSLFIIRELDHDITLKILEFVLNSIEKVKPGFLISSMCIFSESNGTKS